MDTLVKDGLTLRINKALDVIRPYLQSDGGNIIFEELTDDFTVKVKLLGACDGCPFSLQTMKAGVEQAIRREIPEIKQVIAVD